MSSPSSLQLQWLSLVGCIWLQATNGANSDFPVYSSQFKRLLSISQVQLNNLAFASDAGKLLGWFSGVSVNFFSLRLVLLIGVSFSLIGYGVQYLFLAHKIAHLSYWQVFLLTALAGNGICWVNTVCYVICIRNFSSSSRIAVGIATSYVGLSAKIYTTLADTIFHPERDEQAKPYVLLNAVCPLLVAAVTIPLFQAAETQNNARSHDGFLVIFLITLATGACLALGSRGSVSSEFWSTEHIISLGILLIAPVVMPAYVKIREGIEKKRERRVHDLIIDDGERCNRVVVVELKEGLNREEREETSSLWMLQKLDFWLYFFGYMFGPTLGLVFVNNLGQIAESRGFSHVSALVSLSSSFGFFGRLMPSLLDYYVAKRECKISRPGFMATMMAPMAASFFLLLSPSNLILCISTAIAGACSGAITSIAVSATPEFFGTRNFAVNHNIVVVNIPIGSFGFGFLAALLYQREGGKNTCIGVQCYSKTFVIWGCVCSFGTLLCTALYTRRWSGFRSLVSEETNSSGDEARLSFSSNC